MDALRGRVRMVSCVVAVSCEFSPAWAGLTMERAAMAHAAACKHSPAWAGLNVRHAPLGWCGAPHGQVQHARAEGLAGVSQDALRCR